MSSPANRRSAASKRPDTLHAAPAGAGKFRPMDGPYDRLTGCGGTKSNNRESASVQRSCPFITRVKVFRSILKTQTTEIQEHQTVVLL